MRLGPKCSFGINWNLYEEQFRLLKARDPTSSRGGGGGGGG